MSLGNKKKVGIVQGLLHSPKLIIMDEPTNGLDPLMQKTVFSFEILVHDDASTDSTPDIIKTYAEKYPDIIKPILQTENQFSKGINVTQVFQYSRAKGKYIAFCEGDDYWIDSNKLQFQVDWLEQHPQDIGCVHKYIVVDEDENIQNIKEKFLN